MNSTAEWMMSGKTNAERQEAQPDTCYDNH